MDIGLEIAIKNIGLTVSDRQIHIKRNHLFSPFKQKRNFTFEEIEKLTINKSDFKGWEFFFITLHKFFHAVNTDRNSMFVEKEYLEYDLLYDLTVHLKDGSKCISRVKHFDLRKMDKALEEINGMLDGTVEKSIEPQPSLSNS